MPEDNDQGTSDELDQEIEELMKALSHSIAGILPSGWGFSLFLLQYGTLSDAKTIYYASSVEKQDVLNFLREWMRRQTS